MRKPCVFGRSPESTDVLYSAECLRSLCVQDDQFVWQDQRGAGRARWFFGIPRIDHPRAFWLPYCYSRWADYRNARHESLPMLWQTDKEFGVSAVMSNLRGGGLAKRRFALAHALSQYVPVHGNLAMRAGAPADSRMIYHDVPQRSYGKLQFVSRFTHHLCLENESFPGYLTEKLFDALFVGAVPLYAGDPLVGEWFEPGNFLDCTHLDAEAVAVAVRDRRDIAEQIAQRRETLCRMPFEEMESRLHAFQRQILAERGLS